MSGRLARTGAVLAALFCVLFAWWPLVTAPLAGGDFHALVDAGELIRPSGSASLSATLDRLYAVHGAEGHPLASLSLGASALAWSSGDGEGGRFGPRAALASRLESLALLLASAWALGAFVRRLLLPWTGSEQASAAGWAVALLFAVYPLNASALASLTSRGDLLGLALAAAACATFLRSRQEHRHGATVFAGVLAILAGLASEVALGLPPVLAAAELASARRYRPLPVRLRTAATTLVVFGACVGLDILLRLLRGRSGAEELAALGAGPAAGDLGSALSIGIEKLGLLVLPVNVSAIGIAGYGIAGALVLLALQPALLAARSAPRLWGWLVLSWCATMALAELRDPWVRVHADDVSRAAALVPATAVMCAGLAGAATALSGLRRTLIPIAIAAGFTVLAHANALAWSAAAREVEGLRSHLEAARETYGRDARILVLEPPGRSHGVDALEGVLPWMLDGSFSARSGGGSAPDVRSLGVEAFLALAREPELDRLRESPLIISLPTADLGAQTTELPSREALLLPRPAPSEAPTTWYREGRSPSLDLEAFSSRALRVRTAAAAEPTRAPIAHWRASSGVAPGSSLRGAWLASEPGVAVFDLCSSLAWILGERITRIWPEEGWVLIQEAKVLEELPPVAEGLAPRVEGADWLFDRPHAPDADETRSSWRFELLDLNRFDHAVLEVVATDGALRAPRAAERAAELARSGGPVAWSLERRVDGIAVARSRGR
jgi:hypothetical protein